MRWTAPLIVALIVFGQSSGVASAGSAVSIAAGGTHTCAVLDTGRAKCWGRNNRGQLGDGGSPGGSTPAGVQGLSGAATVAAGFEHTCALLTDGRVMCWGHNGYGQLGDGGGSGQFSDVPVRVRKLRGAIAIAAGSFHTCAVLDTGRAKCWGNNSNGQLGDGTTDQRSIPVVVMGRVAAIAAGFAHTCALLTTRQLMCWGYNGAGQLGIGSFYGTYSLPKDVVNPSGVEYAAVAAGDLHSCAVTVGARAKCWGGNGYGQLGIDSKTPKNEPQRVLRLSDVIAIAGGNNHTCAVSGANAKCWGSNIFGQLGIGTTTDSLTPVRVQGLSGVVGIATGQAHTCALLTNGPVKCWGRNSFGQLGDGTEEDQLTPVRVKGL